MTTRYLLLTLFALLGLSLTGYAPAEEAAADAGEAIKFEAPLLITDIGQGNSSKLVEALLKRAGDYEFTSDSTAKADMLEGMKTLIVGVGASSKGLGAAGLNADEEYDRGKALLDAAKANNIPVIGVHIGGLPRRGELSDRFNKQVFENSTVFIAWNGGNEDGFFTDLSKETGVPLIVTEDKRAVGTELTTLLTDGYMPKAAAEEKTEENQQAKAE